MHLSYTRCVILLLVCLGFIGLMCAVRVEGRIPHKTNHHDSRGDYALKSRYRDPPDGSRHSSISGMVQSQRRRRTRHGGVCGSETSSNLFHREEFWIRNKCHNGFLSVLENETKARVVAYSSGNFSQHHSAVKVIKETFKCPGDRFQGPVQTRIYHPKSNKYVCFNRRGRVRAVSKARANRMGQLCSFYEISVDVDSFGNGDLPMPSSFSSSSSFSSFSSWLSTSPTSVRHRFVQYQSVYGRQKRSEVWLLGFHKSLSRAKKLRNGDVIYLPKSMLKKRRGSLIQRNIREDSCAFMFATGKYSTAAAKKAFSGLYDRVNKDHKDLLQRQQSPALLKSTQGKRPRKGPLRRSLKRRRPGRKFSASRMSSIFSSSSSSLSKNHRLQDMKVESLLEQDSDIDVISELSPSRAQPHRSNNNNINHNNKQSIDSHSDFMKQHEENLLQ
ncbi:uncharacterized protein LOC131880597 isoform X2 [Tigriopus californicus]|uniref:uncharacterized protein LOC131880597 isoform X2 n=1 Tax=Tigriopus californicus TaxID=6832 RepID=UPI0027DA3EC8|nr:uncharacterized protein LOC131880597 isoform X2 [Tigriopus californicus]